MAPKSRSKRCASCGYYLPRGASGCSRCAEGHASYPSASVPKTTSTALCKSCCAMERLFDHFDGWLRVTRSASGEYSAKWRFTSGSHTGRYVFWRGGKYDTLSAVLDGLAEKREDVDAGKLRPSLDDRIY